jgi:hypothetical protein
MAHPDAGDKDERYELPDEPFALPDVEPVELPEGGEPARAVERTPARGAPAVARDPQQSVEEPDNGERERCELIDEPFALPDVEPIESPEGTALDGK